MGGFLLCLRLIGFDIIKPLSAFLFQHSPNLVPFFKFFLAMRRARAWCSRWLWWSRWLWYSRWLWCFVSLWYLLLGDPASTLVSTLQQLPLLFWEHLGNYVLTRALRIRAIMVKPFHFWGYLSTYKPMKLRPIMHGGANGWTPFFWPPWHCRVVIDGAITYHLLTQSTVSLIHLHLCKQTECCYACA